MRRLGTLFLGMTACTLGSDGAFATFDGPAAEPGFATTSGNAGPATDARASRGDADAAAAGTTATTSAQEPRAPPATTQVSTHDTVDAGAQTGSSGEPLGETTGLPPADVCSTYATHETTCHPDATFTFESVRTSCQTSLDESSARSAGCGAAYAAIIICFTGRACDEALPLVACALEIEAQTAICA